MEDEHGKRVWELQLRMGAAARPGFDDKDIEHLQILVRLTMDFCAYLNATPPWPQFPDDPFHDMTYKIDSILFNIDSFLAVVHAYAVLVGSTGSTVDWNAIQVGSLKDKFLSLYRDFIAATDFETQCRLLLDLMKLQIVFAGAFYDCEP